MKCDYLLRGVDSFPIPQFSVVRHNREKMVGNTVALFYREKDALDYIEWKTKKRSRNEPSDVTK